MKLLPLFLTVNLIALLPTVSSQNSCPDRCISIRDCPSQLELLLAVQRGTAAPGSFDILRSSICSFQNNNPLVCCPPSTPTPPPRTTPAPPRIQPTIPNPFPSPPRPNTPLLPRNCGHRSLVSRVVSGEDAPLLAWPFIALLESEGPDGRLTFPCGGAIISENYVLTAAHCVDIRTSGFEVKRVRVGEHTLSMNPDCRQGICVPAFQNADVAEVIIHEDYGKPRGCRNCNDLALLRLSWPLSFDDLYIQPVCLPTNLETDLGFSTRQFNSQSAWVAGWGSIHPDRFVRAQTLQQVLLPINETKCSLDLQSFPNRDAVLCAGGKQQDTCRGDSGGPMVMGNRDDVLYLVGIISKGPRHCATANTGGIYMNVNFYVPWIMRNMRP